MASELQILIIEDEPDIRRFLRVGLNNQNYVVIEASKGEEGLQLLAQRKPQLVILDLGLPDIDGLDVIKRMREWSTTPIIILSARDKENDKVAAFECGADDYLTKPFGVNELLARVKVALRHASVNNEDRTEQSVFEAGDIKIDLSLRVVYKKNEQVHLTPTEYKLLLMLIKNPGKLITQQQLLRDVWGPGYAKEGHYLRTYMGQLRHKLEENAARPRHLMTEPGVGYRFIN